MAYYTQLTTAVIEKETTNELLDNIIIVGVNASVSLFHVTSFLTNMTCDVDIRK